MNFKSFPLPDSGYPYEFRGNYYALVNKGFQPWGKMSEALFLVKIHANNIFENYKRGVNLLSLFKFNFLSKKEKCLLFPSTQIKRLRLRLKVFLVFETPETRQYPSGLIFKGVKAPHKDVLASAVHILKLERYRED